MCAWLTAALAILGPFRQADGSHPPSRPSAPHTQASFEEAVSANMLAFGAFALVLGLALCGAAGGAAALATSLPKRAPRRAAEGGGGAQRAREDHDESDEDL